MEYKVYVIILNYNHKDDLKETIESFNNQDYDNLQIVVSDNGSKDDSISWLKEAHPKIVILENKANLGWAEGNNVGIRYALEKNADFVLLANNDLSFRNSKIISTLIKCFDETSNLGIIGPKQNSFYSPKITVNEGWVMYPKEKYKFNILRSNYNASSLANNYKIVDNVSGSFMLIRREVFDDIGLMDIELFLYAEDTDFSLRAWKKGWVSIVDSNLTILHKISATAGQNSPLKIYYKTRNLIYLIRKHSDIQESSVFFLQKYYYDFLKSVVKIGISKRYSEKRFLKLKALIIGFYHGVVIKRMNKFY